MFPKLKASSCVIAILSSSFLAFGLYNVHSLACVTEGGVLGLTLLLEYHFSISPAISNFVLNAVCYLIGWRLLGKEFIAYSTFATIGFSITYKICEQFEPLWPTLADHPLLASIIGAVFVGIGAGFCVRVGGAPSGDDAIAMSISHITHLGVQWVYLISDLCVVGLSLTYIPLGKIMYSLLTVILSGQIIGLIVKLPPREKIFDQKKKSEKTDFS